MKWAMWAMAKAGDEYCNVRVCVALTEGAPAIAVGRRRGTWCERRRTLSHEGKPIWRARVPETSKGSIRGGVANEPQYNVIQCHPANIYLTPWVTLVSSVPCISLSLLGLCFYGSTCLAHSGHSARAPCSWGKWACLSYCRIAIYSPSNCLVMLVRDVFGWEEGYIRIYQNISDA